MFDIFIIVSQVRANKLFINWSLFLAATKQL